MEERGSEQVDLLLSVRDEAPPELRGNVRSRCIDIDDLARCRSSGLRRDARPQVCFVGLDELRDRAAMAWVRNAAREPPLNGALVDAGSAGNVVDVDVGLV